MCDCHSHCMALPGWLSPCPVGTGFSTVHLRGIYNRLAATERCISPKAVILLHRRRFARDLGEQPVFGARRSHPRIGIAAEPVRGRHRCAMRSGTMNEITLRMMKVMITL